MPVAFRRLWVHGFITTTFMIAVSVLGKLVTLRLFSSNTIGLKTIQWCPIALERAVGCTSTEDGRYSMSSSAETGFTPVVRLLKMMCEFKFNPFLEKCFYIDGQTSNIVWEENVCYTVFGELNGGRYNVFRNNVWLCLYPGSGRCHIADVNCVGTDGNCIGAPTTSTWSTCYNSIAKTDKNGYTTYNFQWLDRFPNGTKKGFVSKANQAYIDMVLARSPILAYETWCQPNTAGPNNKPCATNSTTITYPDGSQFKFPCELMPTNNRFGSDEYYGFNLIYNSSSNPYGIKLVTLTCEIYALL